MGKFLTVAALLLAVGGCQGVTPLAINTVLPLGSAGTMATMPQTKKLPSDHLLSWVTGRDCSMISYEQDGVLCPDARRVDEGNVYCIKTLGSVECHRRPDPYYGREQILGTPPVKYVERP